MSVGIRRNQRQSRFPIPEGGPTKAEKLAKAERIKHLTQLVQQNRERVKKGERPLRITGEKTQEIIGAGAEVVVIEALNMSWEEDNINIKTTCTRATPKEDIQGTDAKLIIEASRQGRRLREWEVNIQIKAVPMDRRIWSRGHIPTTVKEKSITNRGNVVIWLEEPKENDTIYVIVNSDEINETTGIAKEGLLDEIREKAQEFISRTYIG